MLVTLRHFDKDLLAAWKGRSISYENCISLTLIKRPFPKRHWANANPYWVSKPQRFQYVRPLRCTLSRTQGSLLLVFALRISWNVAILKFKLKRMQQIFNHSILFYTVRYDTYVRDDTIRYDSLPHYAMLCYTVLYCNVLYCTILYYSSYGMKDQNYYFSASFCVTFSAI